MSYSLVPLAPATMAELLAETLRANGGCTFAPAPDTDREDLFRRVRALVPCVAILNRGTMSFATLVEDPTRYGWNGAINHRTDMERVNRMLANYPERVLR